MCFIGIINSKDFFDTLRLHLRLVRALQIAGGNQECFIHRACDSLQIDLPKVSNRSLHLDFEVLQWSQVGRHLDYSRWPPLRDPAIREIGI